MSKTEKQGASGKQGLWMRIKAGLLRLSNVKKASAAVNETGSSCQTRPVITDLSNKLDAADRRILRTLQEDARLSTKELAARVGLSSTPVFERLKRLEKAGYIKKYITVLDAEKLGQGFSVFCNVKMSHINSKVAADFAEVVRGIDEVAECYNISGGNDYLLKIHAPNMAYYKEFILSVLGEISYISSVESLFVMDEVKHEYGLPL